MSEVCRIDLERRAEIPAKLKAFADGVRTRYRTERIILFGSAARDELHEASDIDVAVIADFPESYFERLIAIRRLTDLPIEPWAYTPAEFAEMVRAGSSFAQEILTSGRDL